MGFLVLIGFIGGVVTGISPCILPVLPVIFFAGGAQGARFSSGEASLASSSSSRLPSSEGFSGVRFTGVNLVGEGAQPISALAKAIPGGGLRVSPWRPYLVVAGLVTSFTLFALVGSTILSLLGLPQDFLHWASILVLGLIGAGMLIPGLMELLERPFTRFGKSRAQGASNGFLLGLLLGAAYVPCAGPVLAAISVAGSTGEVGADTLALALSFAVGTAVPLLFFALAGRRLTERIAAFRRREGMVRALAGVSLIALAAGLLFNIPARIQAFIPDWTQGAQAATHEWLSGSSGDAVACVDGAEALGECQELPDFTGIAAWLNSDAPVSRNDLLGAVSLIDFWSYNCVNCQKSLPVIQQLHDAYGEYGLKVLSVHSPEYAFEKETRNVEAAIAEHGITFPVGVDSDLATWKSFNNAYWPSLYLADHNGTVRYFKYGEGAKGLLEQHIRTLLREADSGRDLPEPLFSTAEDENAPRTTHTVLGSEGGRGFVAGALPAGASSFEFLADQKVDTFALQGEWKVEPRFMEVVEGTGKVRVRYFGTQVTILAEGHGQVVIHQASGDVPVEIHGPGAVLTLASHDSAAEGSVDVSVPAGVKLTELEILGNVCGNGKCGGDGPAWAK